MKVQISLTNFAPDYDAEANFVITLAPGGEPMMVVKFDFATESETGQYLHVVTHEVTAPAGLSHYMQTFILFECSKMVESFFSGSVDPYDSITIEI